MGEHAVVVAACRTPFTRLDGALADQPVDALACIVIRDLVERVPDAPPDDVIVATATGSGGNPARRAALAAGLDPSIPGLTLDRQCGGGLDAIMLACRLVESGAGTVYIAGGAESASTSPLRTTTSRERQVGGRGFFPRSAFAPDGHDDPGMAESAEDMAAERGIDRERQDAYAARSHARALAARDDGVFDREIVACEADGTSVVLDECPRPTLTAERMARLPAVVRREGTVTAGNASQIADGAAAVVVMSGSEARRRGLGGLRHRDSITVGVDPGLPNLGAIAAVRRLRERHHDLDPAAVAHVAMTEAFAAQMIATIDELGLDPTRVNPHGGSIALGHPWGASGALQVVRLFSELAGRDGAWGLALAAVAGGMGSAAWFEGLAA